MFVKNNCLFDFPSCLKMYMVKRTWLKSAKLKKVYMPLGIMCSISPVHLSTCTRKDLLDLILSPRTQKSASRWAEIIFTDNSLACLPHEGRLNVYDHASKPKFCFQTNLQVRKFCVTFSVHHLSKNDGSNHFLGPKMCGNCFGISTMTIYNCFLSLLDELMTLHIKH